VTRACLVLLLLALTGCGGAQVGGGAKECSEDAACAAPPGGPDLRILPLRRFEGPVGEGTTQLDTSVVEASGDGVVVSVSYPDLCQRLLGAEVVETAELVEVVVVGTAREEGPCALRLVTGHYSVTLDAPVGDRLVRVGG
jgi:hypothetical protein